ncbi:hypothetical protein BDW68DRAFT_166087 [Aspergillus falconensis]
MTMVRLMCVLDLLACGSQLKRKRQDLRNKVIHTVLDAGIHLGREARRKAAQTPDGVDVAQLFVGGEGAPVAVRHSPTKSRRVRRGAADHSLRTEASSALHCC